MSDIRITPGSSIMSFTSSLNYVETLKQDDSGSLNLYGSGSLGRTEIFSIDGNNGRLFTVTDDLSDSLFSVNTIAGLPVIEAFANNTVVMGQYGTNALVVSGSNVGIGTASPSSYYKLDVNGDVRISQSLTGGGAAPSGTSYSRYIIDGKVGNYGSFSFNARSDVDQEAFGSVGIGIEPDGGIDLYCYSLDYGTQSYISFNLYDFTMQSSGDFGFLTKPSTTYQTSLLIKNTGNVVIGGNGSLLTSDVFQVNGSGYFSSNINVGGGLTINGSLNSGGSNFAGYRQGGDNIILKGNSAGVSGIFFQSEKDGTNINHPTDYGYIQFHSYGIDGTTGESNKLVIGVANDTDDMVVLQSPYKDGVKISYLNGTNGTGGTAYTVWHQGNDGSGSGLDADLLDGKHATDFIPTTHAINSISNGTGFLKNNGSGVWSYDNSTYDNYQSWILKTNGVQRTTIQTGGILDLVAGSNVSLSYGAGGVVTINSTDTNTTYSAGTGLTLTGTVFTPTFGTTAGTVAQGNDSRIINGQIAHGWGDHAGLYIPVGQKGVANGVATLDASGLIPTTQLPSYVDDVIEAADLTALNALPAGGKQTGKIYVALDTNKSYRWSGSTFIHITSGAVDSVAGKTGVVTLVKGDVGLGNVDNTSDSTKSVASAAKLTTARTIGGVSFDGTANINLPGVNTAGNQNTTGNATTATTLQTARTLTIGATGKTFDGSANVAWTLSEIGAMATSHVANAISSTDINTWNDAVTKSGTQTITGAKTFNSIINFSNNVGGIQGTIGDNDYWRIIGNNTASNAGYLEIATADDGNEPIYVRQYTGVFSSLTRTAVLLDGSGNTSFPGTITAPTFSGNLSGNAATATTLQTARTINGTSFNGSTDITTANWGTARTITVGNTGKSVNGSGNVSWSLAEIGALGNSGQQRITKTAHAHNADDYHLELYSPDSGSSDEVSLRMHQGSRFYGQIRLRNDGFHFTQGNNGVYRNIYFDTAFGTLSGNASTATTLQTARTINGTSFNGSANITTATWGTGRTITIGATGKTVDGSGNVSWTLAEMGAQASLVTSTSPTGSTNLTTSNTNTYLNITQNGASPGSSTQITGAGSVTVSSDTSGKLTITGTDTNTTYSAGTGLTLTGTVFTPTFGTTAGTVAQGNHTHTFASLTSIPTTIAGYGITDAPTKTGTGASGTWGINITGNATNATNSSNTLRVTFNDGPRDLSDRLPSTFARSVVFDFVSSGIVGGIGNFAGVMTFSPWEGTTSSTGDSSYQLGFINETGINGSGLPGLVLRKGIDTTWGSFRQVAFKPTVKTVTAATYTVIPEDANNIIIFTANNVTVTMTSSSINKEGDAVQFEFQGTGSLTVVGSGATILVNQNRAAVSDGQHSTMVVQKLTASSYKVYGEIV